MSNSTSFSVKSQYPINSKITRGLIFFFSQKLRVIFECGLFSSADWILFFFFFWPETNAYSSIKKSLSWWFHFQQLSEFQNILNLCPKIQIHQQMQWISAKFTKSFRIIIECGLKSSAGWILFFSQKLRIIIECGL